MASLAVPLLCFTFLLLACFTSSQAIKCTSGFTYHFGDGTTDIGNSVRIKPWGPELPAAKWPYGMTNPGWPTGRWGDGFIIFDFASVYAGYPDIVPYLSGNLSTNAVIFSVARSPVLDRSFFKARGIKIEPFAVSLSSQLKWFRRYLRTVTTTQQESFNRVQSSFILLGDVEGNDISYALTQGKSIDEVKTYVPAIINEQVKALRELISLGAKFFMVPGSTLLGCYPFILTALQTENPDAYDEYGCLKSVNDLIDYKNDYLEQAVANLTAEFPEVLFRYSAFGDGLRKFMDQYVVPGTIKLDTCCGIGGKYHYDSKRFCGSPGVPVCSNPKEYMFWDGIHLTEITQDLVEKINFQPAQCPEAPTTSVASM